ncbi:MAG TPA: hypothetical protein VL126_16510 [Bacteroidota bacterium]|nr:hypothetical protein [Bacteroidota bacterium]
MDTEHEDGRAYLRHALATLAYRAAKALRGAPAAFATFRVGESTRRPGEILAHMCDLIDWAISIANGEQAWHDSKPRAWEIDCQRFFDALTQFDRCLASNEQLGSTPQKLFQGPVADALTHVGQLTLLRRLSGAPVRGENYFKAKIAVGRAGADQSAAEVEFD